MTSKIQQCIKELHVESVEEKRREKKKNIKQNGKQTEDRRKET